MSQTPRLEEVIHHAVNGRLEQFYTALPAEITHRDPANRFVNIRILVANPFDTPDGKPEWHLPEIHQAPLVMPWGKNKAGKAFGMSHPVAVGDQVLYIVSTLPIDQYMTRGSALLNEDRDLLNSLSHGFVIPGSFWLGDLPATIPDDALVIYGEKVKVGGPTGTQPTIMGTAFSTDLNDLLDLVSLFAATVNNAATSDGGAAKTGLIDGIEAFKTSWSDRLTSNTEVK